MADMLVKLYSLKSIDSRIMKKIGISIRRPLPSEKSIVIDWVRNHFSKSWADECEVTFSNMPVSTYIAIADQEIVGFASYDAACRNFFGPTGVNDRFRCKGIGEALLLQALFAMREQGYAYGIIGGVGPADFYAAKAGAVLIEDSDPGIYTNPLKKNP
jgi:predicted GNAT family acetyltransferase